MNAVSPDVRLRLIGFKPMTRGTLIGFAEIAFEPIGLHVIDVHVHRHEDGTAYALLPSKPQLRADRTVVIGANGKPAYAPVLKFESKAAADRFSKAVVSLVKRRHPEALDGDAA